MDAKIRKKTTRHTRIGVFNNEKVIIDTNTYVYVLV